MFSPFFLNFKFKLNVSEILKSCPSKVIQVVNTKLYIIIFSPKAFSIIFHVLARSNKMVQRNGSIDTLSKQDLFLWPMLPYHNSIGSMISILFFFLINRLQSSILNHCSPYEKLFYKQPNYNLFQNFWHGLLASSPSLQSPYIGSLFY